MSCDPNDPDSIPRYQRNPLIPQDEEGKDIYLTQELDKIEQFSSNLAQYNCDEYQDSACYCIDVCGGDSYACDAYSSALSIEATAHWEMQQPNQSNTAPDSTGNGNFLSVAGTPTTGVPANPDYPLDECEAVTGAAIVDSEWWTTNGAPSGYLTTSFTMGGTFADKGAKDHGLMFVQWNDSPASKPSVKFSRNGGKVSVGAASWGTQNETTSQSGVAYGPTQHIMVTFSVGGSQGAWIIDTAIYVDFALVHTFQFTGDRGNVVLTGPELRVSGAGGTTGSNSFAKDLFYLDHIVTSEEIATLKKAWDRNQSDYVGTDNFIPTVGDILRVIAVDADGDATWCNEPKWPGGGVNQVLTRTGTGVDDVIFKDVGSVAGGLPTEGTAGQQLVKIDATDYNAQWVDRDVKTFMPTDNESAVNQVGDFWVREYV